MSTSAIPKWLLQEPESTDLAGMNKDLVQAFKEEVLVKLPETPQGKRVREEAYTGFMRLVEDLGLIDEDAKANALDRFETDVLPGLIKHDESGVDQEQLAAVSQMQALLSAMQWHVTQDKYVLYILAKASEESWWAHTADEFETFEEFIQTVCEKKMGKKSSGPLTGHNSEWNWIARYLVPALRKGGMSAAKIAAAVTLSTKMRTAVPKLRYITDQYAQDPERAITELSAVIENEILNPEVSVRDIAKSSPNHSGDKVAKKIPANATAMTFTGADGSGFMVVQTEQPAQAKAIEKALKGIVESEDESSFPIRDPLGVVNQLKSQVAAGPIPVRREQITNDQLFADKKNGLVVEIVPVQLSDLFEKGQVAVDEAIDAVLGPEWLWSVEKYELISFAGNELHIKFSLDCMRRYTLFSVYSRTNPKRSWTLKIVQVNDEALARSEGARLRVEIVAQHPEAQVGLKPLSVIDPNAKSPDTLPAGDEMELL